MQENHSNAPEMPNEFRFMAVSHFTCWLATAGAEISKLPFAGRLRLPRVDAPTARASQSQCAQPDFEAEDCGLTTNSSEFAQGEM